MKKKEIIFLLMCIIFLIVKFLGGTFFVSIFVAISLPLLYLLGKSRGKVRIVSILLGLSIGLADFIFIILLLVPTRTYNINVDKYYQKKENYIKIYVKDKSPVLDSLYLLIKRSGSKQYIKYKIKYYKKGTKIKVFENDKIYFIGKKTAKTYIILYLWDNSIIRILPGTKLSMRKLTKNLKKLDDSKTQINLEQGSIWFHVIRLIKGSNNMNIQTQPGQAIIIRGTAGLISVDGKNTYVVDYSHVIEVKDMRIGKSTLLQAGEGAIIKNNKIEKTNLESILQNMGFSKTILKNFETFDKEQISKFRKEIIGYIKNQFSGYNGILSKLEYMKLKIFSIGNSTYKNYLSNYVNYEYLIGEGKYFANSILNDPNLAFVATYLGKTQVKVKYLYNQLIETIKQTGYNIRNSDIYKTYIINLGIEQKVKDIGSFIKIQGNDLINNLMKKF